MQLANSSFFFIVGFGSIPASHISLSYFDFGVFGEFVCLPILHNFLRSDWFLFSIEKTRLRYSILFLSLFSELFFLLCVLILTTSLVLELETSLLCTSFDVLGRISCSTLRRSASTLFFSLYLRFLILNFSLCFLASDLSSCPIFV